MTTWRKFQLKVQVEEEEEDRRNTLKGTRWETQSQRTDNTQTHDMDDHAVGMKRASTHSWGMQCEEPQLVRVYCMRKSDFWSVLATHKRRWNVCVWHVLGGLIFYDLWKQFAPAVTKWAKTCDKRLIRLIENIHCKQYYYVWNTSQHWRKGFCQEVKRSSISWLCKKQTSDSDSSTEAEVISVDAGLRIDSRSWSLAMSDWSISFLTQTKEKNKDV